jgi:hypothetical protein
LLYGGVFGLLHFLKGDKMKDKKRKGYMGGGRNPYRYGGTTKQKGSSQPEYKSGEMPKCMPK